MSTVHQSASSRHHEVGELGERLLVVERSAQDVAGTREILRGLLGAFSLCDVPPLRGEPAIRERIAVERRPAPAIRRPGLECDRNALACRTTHQNLGLGACELRIDFPHDAADQLLGAVAGLAEYLRGPRVDVSEAPVDVLHDERVGDALENAACEPLRALCGGPGCLRLHERILEALGGQLDLLSELLRLLRLYFELDRLILQLMVQCVELLGASFGGLARSKFGGEANRLHLRGATLGEVPGDLRESHYPSAVVAQGRDDDVRPEARAVLPQPPAFVLEPAVPRRTDELHRGLSRLDVFRGIEDREMAPDDLRRLVALEVRRARVPCENASACVQREDRVVADARHEQAIELGRFVRLAASAFVPGLPFDGGRHRARKRRPRRKKAACA